LEDLGVDVDDNIKMIFVNRVRALYWTHLSQVMAQFGAVLNTVMTVWFY